jgi:hypothetical protein
MGSQSWLQAARPDRSTLSYHTAASRKQSRDLSLDFVAQALLPVFRDSPASRLRPSKKNTGTNACFTAAARTNRGAELMQRALLRDVFAKYQLL